MFVRLAAAVVTGGAAALAIYCYFRRNRRQAVPPLLGRKHTLLPALPVLGLGTGGVPPSKVSEPTVEAVVAALKSGVTLIDVAENYGEASLGEGLRRAGAHAAKAFLLCKCDLAPTAVELPELRVRRQVMRTLRHVGRSRLDAVIIHWPVCLGKVADDAEHAAARRGAWRGLEALVDKGVIGVIGVSNWTVELLDELLTYARIRPAINEIEFSPICCQTRLVAACYERNIVAVGYSPYGACWMALYMSACHKVPWGVTNLLGDETVKTIAAEVGATPAQVRLASLPQRSTCTLKPCHLVTLSPCHLVMDMTRWT